MENVIKKIDYFNEVSETEIASEFNKLFPKPEDNKEVSMELKAESMAFEFVENYRNKENSWGTYFGPMMVWSNGDGTLLETPSISLVTPEIIAYWTKRIYETNNPILKARYSGLVWDFSKKVLNSSPNFNIGITYIESLIEIVEGRKCKYTAHLIQKIKKAIQVAIGLNAKELIEKAKNATIKLEKEIAENNKPGLWGFSFDILVNNSNINLTNEEESDIIKSLESRFNEFCTKPDLNPWNAEIAAERLAEYYKNKGNVEKTKEIIFQLGNTFEYNEENGSAIQLSSKLQHLYKIYSTYGLIDKANAVLIRLRETGPKINKELNHNSFSFEIPEEKLDAFINFMIDGTPNYILHKIIQYFIPKKDEIKDRIYKLAKTTPLNFLINKSLQDNKGRIIATIGSLDEDFDGNLIYQLSQSLSFQSIFLHQIFNKITSEDIIKIDQFNDFIYKSPVFEESRLDIIHRGIKAYYDKDLLVAIHLLIPQVENAFRNLLELAGGVVLKKNRDGGFQLKTFDEILRDEKIKEVLGEDIQLYLICLFTNQRGWNIRNDVCHGMSELDYFSFQVIERILHVLLILGTIKKK